MVYVLIIDLNDYAKEYYAANKESHNIYMREYYVLHKEKIAKQHKKWNAANKEKIKQKLQEKLIKELKEYYLKGANK